MSREDLSYKPPLVQTLITSYYNVRDPPQLVQQRITQYFLVSDSINGELQSVGDFSASSYDSASDAVSSDTHISGKPMSMVGKLVGICIMRTLRYTHASVWFKIQEHCLETAGLVKNIFTRLRLLLPHVQ